MFFCVPNPSELLEVVVIDDASTISTESLVGEAQKNHANPELITQTRACREGRDKTYA